MRGTTYTWMFVNSRLVFGSAGCRTTDTAVSRPRTKATVVKYPKTLWNRLDTECIVAAEGAVLVR